MNPLSRQHLKNLRRLHLKKYRDQDELYLIEGLRLCEEAAAEGAPIHEVVISPRAFYGERAERLLTRFQDMGVIIWTTDDAGIHALADTQSPQGIIGVVKQKALPDFDVTAQPDSLVLALEGISDPGNLGTILRTADWFGVRTVLLGQSSATVTNPKTVRGTMGALFRLCIHEDVSLSTLAPVAREAGYRLIAAVAREGMPASRLRPGRRDMLFIGSEANGLSAELENEMNLRVTIEQHGGGESLNAAIAASILLYQWSIGH